MAVNAAYAFIICVGTYANVQFWSDSRPAMLYAFQMSTVRMLFSGRLSPLVYGLDGDVKKRARMVIRQGHAFY